MASFDLQTLLRDPVGGAGERDRSAYPVGGDDRTRTGDPRLAKAVLYQLSYVPKR